ncbi:MAG: transcriptional repressor [Deinococcota bacterium]
MKRHTSQRQAILDVLQEASGPLTPQEVLEHARTKKRSLGLATVYRNLNTLSEEGAINAVCLPGDRTRYEVREPDHHHHFYCNQCGHVYTLMTPCPVRLSKDVNVPNGFQVTRHELTFYGTCATCKSETSS